MMCDACRAGACQLCDPEAFCEHYLTFTGPEADLSLCLRKAREDDDASTVTPGDHP